MYRVASGKEPAPIPEHLSTEGRNFLQWCFKRYLAQTPPVTQITSQSVTYSLLCRDPNDRATVKYLRGHPWVSMNAITTSMHSGSSNSNSAPPPPPRSRSNVAPKQSSGSLNTIMGACEVPTYNPAAAAASQRVAPIPPPPH